MHISAYGLPAESTEVSPAGWTSVFSTLTPGQDFPAHFHHHHVEIIIVTRGKVTIWDGLGKDHSLHVGEMAVVGPPERHYVQNTGNEPAHLVAIKIAPDCSVTADQLLQDRSFVEWLPSNQSDLKQNPE